MDCPKCGQQWPDLSGGALQGGCPSCLLEFAFGPSAPPSDLDDGLDVPPARLGPYHILGTLGRGGMGVVYLARHEGLDRTVALKLLNPAIARQKSFPERFQREGQVLAALAHPNIVGVYDLGCEAGTYFLAMERVVGQTLRQIIDAGPLPPARAVPLFAQLCEALQYAHDHGVVHRDIKPENVLVEDSGRVKIGDFGVAKLIGDGSSVQSSLTQSGAVVGTRCYTAPEQLERGKSVDHRADLFALGVVLYEMLTGELPLGIFPPPSRKAAIDPRFDAMVLRALAKERDQRPASAREFKEQVQRLQATPARRRWTTLLAGSILIAILCAVGAVVFRQGGTDEPVVTQRVEITVPQVTALENTGRRILSGHKGKVLAVAFDPARPLLATSGEDRKVRLWDSRTGVESGAFDAIPRPEAGNLPLAFAPGGRRLATASGDGIVRIWEVARRKESLTMRGHGREVASIAFSPDGNTLASASHDRTVRLWDTQTGKPRHTLDGFADPVLAVAYSPDGNRLAAGAMNGGVKLWDAKTNEEVAKCGHARRVYALAFSPNSELLATGSHERNIKLWDLTMVPPRPTLLVHGAEVWAVAFSPEGDVLASGGHDGIVRLWDPGTGKLLDSLTGHSAPVVTLAFSPDGRYLASGSWDQTAIVWDRKSMPRGQNRDLYPPSFAVLLPQEPLGVRLPHRFQRLGIPIDRLAEAVADGA
ncbi:MAG: serine/threonine protein kinase [Gemmataceae bacterium]|nr:serine/threonine protein kinase [Gemmataceae bacterium]